MRVCNVVRKSYIGVGECPLCGDVSYVSGVSTGVSGIIGWSVAACAAIVASMCLCMSLSMFITSIGDPSGSMLSASHRGVVACITLVVSRVSCLVSGCSCPHLGRSRSVGVCSVASDLAWRIAGGSGSILFFGVTGRLILVLDLLLSGVGLHWRAGFGLISIVPSAHVGHVRGGIGGDVGDLCRSYSGRLEGPLIVP